MATRSFISANVFTNSWRFLFSELNSDMCERKKIINVIKEWKNIPPCSFKLLNPSSFHSCCVCEASLNYDSARLFSPLKNNVTDCDILHQLFCIKESSKIWWLKTPSYHLWRKNSLTKYGFWKKQIKIVQWYFFYL